ncbi:MAG TPA: aldo/keto reductase, partial [Solirubrobacteraceae bacterium]
LQERGLACLPYYALARGFLSGKYRQDSGPVDSVRAQGVLDSYVNERGFAVLEALDEIAAARATSVASVALAWLRIKPTVLAPIASASSPEQLTELMASVALELSPRELTQLDEASA